MAPSLPGQIAQKAAIYESRPEESGGQLIIRKALMSVPTFHVKLNIMSFPAYNASDQRKMEV
jgi:hypothetical protein